MANEDLTIPIDNNVPLPDGKDPAAHYDLVRKAEAALATLEKLEHYGAKIDFTVGDEDMEVASALVTAHAHNPEGTQNASVANVAGLTPAALKLTKAILDEFGHRVADSSMKIRETVVNKLIIETENDDARIRLRALELLGKMSDVGLFTEKSEVTVTHQTSEDLRLQLREKLQRLKDVTPAEDAVLIEDTDNDSRHSRISGPENG